MERKIQVRDFAIAFASNVIAIDDCQRNKLIKEITDIFSWSDIDYVKDWDSGIDDSLGMGDLLGEAFSEDYYYDEDKDEYIRIEGSLEDEVACAIRTAIDLFVSPSGGVVGFTVGDLKKAFNGICLSVGLVSASTDRGIDEYKGQNILMEALEQEIKKREKVLNELTEKFSARPGHEKEQSIVSLALDYGRELGHFHAYSYMISLIMYNSE